MRSGADLRLSLSPWTGYAGGTPRYCNTADTHRILQGDSVCASEWHMRVLRGSRLFRSYLSPSQEGHYLACHLEEDRSSSFVLLRYHHMDIYP